jgi:hypothetical protein
VDPRTRKDILGQWGVRRENDRERVDREKLERDLDGSPLRGRPLRQRLRNFRPAVDGYVVSLGGPLPYMVRLREIEERTCAHERELRRVWLALADQHAGDGATFARAWRARVERWGFDEVNDLIERHNRWYPAEARLPMDVRRRDYVLVNGEHYSKRLLDDRWALERYPADLSAATRAAA